MARIGLGKIGRVGHGVIDHPSAWTAASLGGIEAIAVDLETRHVDALERALDRARRSGTPREALTAANFDLTPIAADIAAWRAEIRHGRGILLLRGFPIAGRDVDDVATMYFGLGTRFGTALSQSVIGDTLGHVIDMSREKPDARSYQNREGMLLHTDFCDVLAMLSLRPAAAGGESRYCSAIAVYNAIAREHPEFLEPLLRGFPFHLMGEEDAGAGRATEFDVPIFSIVDGFLSCIFSRGLVLKGAAVSGRALGNLELGAIECLVETCHRPEIMREHRLAPGELMIANNLITLHARTEIANLPDAPRRHLMRLWLRDDDARPRIRQIDIYGNGGGISRQDAKRPTYADDALDRAVRGLTIG
jgi:hypothetical protein